ncbi:hypothetical protein [Streptomyces violaceusniger]|uniref:Uncharacterized protein n=1 Tax=Streptomyces violaceusniger (strain Tu 4113) TaxID=653045 RepID=G2PHV0_STRV4|nr:hypothetical protein [Streptomyces violaceusniger]AEM88901.1 hypothetical protein Strvi_0125 [Streptomyces violaceusniger Tu 4113]
MSPDRAFRSLSMVMSAAVAVLLYGVVMVVVGLITGGRPLPSSYLVAAAVGAGVGYWKSARILARRRPTRPAPQEEPRT